MYASDPPIVVDRLVAHADYCSSLSSNPSGLYPILTFGLTQAAGAPSVQVRVDQVSIGAWRTPVVESVTPVRIPSGVSATLSITGVNFIDTPTVRLGERSLTDVHWLDDGRVETVVQATLDAGVYDLWVTNPENASTVQIGAVTIGEQTFLPILFGIR